VVIRKKPPFGAVFFGSKRVPGTNLKHSKHIRLNDYKKVPGTLFGIDVFLDCDVLVIDDLGTEPTIKNVTQEHIYNIINERLLNKRAFIITTNLKPSELTARYDERIANRILSKNTSYFIEFKGHDLRVKKG
jgi:DNA replication protein DnaC